jgi:hypothetical protein
MSLQSASAAHAVDHHSHELPAVGPHHDDGGDVHTASIPIQRQEGQARATSAKPVSDDPPCITGKDLKEFCGQCGLCGLCVAVLSLIGEIGSQC